MDNLNIQHKEYANGKWAELPLWAQMGNIGSEVSRSLKWHEKGNQKIFQGAFERALELFDFTIDSLQAKQEWAKLKEVCRAREVYCDYFYDNVWHTDPKSLQRYFDQFVSLGRKL